LQKIVRLTFLAHRVHHVAELCCT